MAAPDGTIYVYGREQVSNKRIVLLMLDRDAEQSSLERLIHAASEVDAYIVILAAGTVNEAIINTVNWLNMASDKETIFHLVQNKDGLDVCI